LLIVVRDISMMSAIADCGIFDDDSLQDLDRERPTLEQHGL
jgi:hypothetical protein